MNVLPNIRSAKKRVKTAETKTIRNKMVKSRVNTYTKKFKVAIEEGNLQVAKELHPYVVKQIDMAVSKGVIHKNSANRKKSKLATALNKLEESNQTSA